MNRVTTDDVDGFAPVTPAGTSLVDLSTNFYLLNGLKHASNLTDEYTPRVLLNSPAVFNTATAELAQDERTINLCANIPLDRSDAPPALNPEEYDWETITLSDLGPMHAEFTDELTHLFNLLYDTDHPSLTYRCFQVSAPENFAQFISEYPLPARE